MSTIKVLLANRPRILREVVRDVIERQPDMEIVGEVLDPLGVLLAAKETESDAVVIGLQDSEEPGLLSHLLAECPHMTVLGLSSQGDTAFIIQMCPLRKEIIEPSEVNILSALRHAVQEPCSEVNKPPSQ